MQSVHLSQHPLIQHKLSCLRQQQCNILNFRQLLYEISLLMAYDVTRDLPTHACSVTTPLEATQGLTLAGKKLVLASILRAGNGLLDGFLEVIPHARVGHIGLYRDPATLMPVSYYYRMPGQLNERDVLVLDPMLATGHSAVAALDRLREDQPKSLRFVCLVSCPEGIATLQQAHAEVPIYTAAIDRELSAKGYILPGLGDAGDRLYGA